MGPTDTDSVRWRRLLLVVAAVNIVVTLLVQLLLAGAVIPPLMVFLLLYAGGIALVRRPGKAGPIMIGVVSVPFVLGNLPFVVQDLSHPTSFLVFSTTLAGLAAAIVGVVAMVGFLRGWPSATAGRVGAVAGAIFVLGTALSVVASLFVSNEGAEPGDLALKASDIEFKPEAAQAKAGRVAVVATRICRATPSPSRPSAWTSRCRRARAAGWSSTPAPARIPTPARWTATRT